MMTVIGTAAWTSPLPAPATWDHATPDRGLFMTDSLSQPQPGAALPVRARRGLRTLVVAPIPVTRWVLRLALERAGYAVEEAADGQAAVELLSRGTPDLVVQDLRLPDMPGTHLLHRVRTACGTALPVLAFSEVLADVQQSQKLGREFTGFLVKPFLPSNLLLTLQFYLGKKLTLRQPRVPVRRARLSQESYSERAGSAILQAPAGGRHILVAEDNADDREELAQCLADAGFEVTTAVNGVEAVRKALDARPDAVVTDTLMPVMDGFELCLMIRLIYQLSLVPVLMTPMGHVEELDRDIALELGANNVVSRRPDFHKVIDALRVCLSEEAPALTRTPAALPSDRRNLLVHYGGESGHADG